MPPQQPNGLLDGFDQLFGFSAHDISDPPWAAICAAN